MKPTTAQLAALRLADRNPIQYFRGGFYTITTEWIKREQPERTLTEGEMVYTTAVTLKALCSRGLLAREHSPFSTDIYARRWTLTDKGRAILDAADKEKP